jgi:hypothetical protein
MDAARASYARVAEETLAPDAPPPWFAAQAEARRELAALEPEPPPPPPQPADEITESRAQTSVVPESFLKTDVAPPVRVPAQAVPPVRPLPASTRGQSPWFWGAVGIGSAGLVIGSATGVLAILESQKLDCAGDLCTGDPEALQRSRVLADAATVSFVVAAAAAASAVGIVLLSPSKARAGTQVGLTVSAGTLRVRADF